MLISYESIGQVCVTCYNSGVQVNQPCKMSTNCSIVACQDTNEIEGVVIASRGSLATVAIKGFVTLPYTGTAPTVGYCSIGATGTGKVKVVDGARKYVVFNVDTNKKTVTFCL